MFYKDVVFLKCNQVIDMEFLGESIVLFKTNQRGIRVYAALCSRKNTTIGIG